MTAMEGKTAVSICVNILRVFISELNLSVDVSLFAFVCHSNCLVLF